MIKFYGFPLITVMHGGFALTEICKDIEKNIPLMSQHVGSSSTPTVVLDYMIPRGRSRFSGKGAHMYKGMGDSLC